MATVVYLIICVYERAA